jgi:hypothetical protein
MIPALRCAAVIFVAPVVLATTLTMPTAKADNKRLNDSVVSNVYTIQQQAGCTPRMC